MRRRFGVLLAALAMVLGLGAVSVVTANEAQALPRTGTHTVYFNCSDGAHQSLTSFTYSLTLFSVGPQPADYYQFDFQLLTATYTGPTSSYFGPHIDINFSGGGLWSNATGHGTPSSPKVFPPGTTNGPTSTLTDGVGATDWVPTRIFMQLSSTPENLMRFTYPNHPCTQTIPMTLEGTPKTGAASTTLTCDAGADGVFEESLALSWDIQPLSGDTFNINITGATYAAEPGRPTGPGGGIGLTLDGAPATPTLDSGSSNWSGVTPSSFSETDGVGGVSFPTRAFTYNVGDPNVSGGVRVHAAFNHTELTPDSTCDAYYTITPRFSVNGDVEVDTISFDDCVGGVGGVLTVTSEWLRDTNNENYKVKSLTMKNVSDSEVRWVTGTASSPGGITYATAAFPFQNIATQTGYVPAADRKIVPGETQVVGVIMPLQWVPMNGGAPGQTPAAWPAPISSSPLFNLFLRVYTPTGDECVPTPIGSDGPLQNLEISPPA